MTAVLRLDGIDHDTGRLSPEGKARLAQVQFIEARIAELTNMQALMTRARNSYVEALRREIVQGRSGVDLNALFSD